MTELVVADTTVWSNFVHARNPRLVLEVFPQIASPRAVLEEIETGRHRGYLAEFDLSWIPEVDMTAPEAVQARVFEDRLEPGEAACLAVAQARDVLCLTDDRAARRLARTLEVRLGGTLGVLVHLVEAQRLTQTEADVLLTRMIRARYRSPVSSLSELI